MPLKLVPLRVDMARSTSRIYLDAFEKSSANRAMLPRRDDVVWDAITKQSEGWINSEIGDIWDSFAVIDTDIPSGITPEGEIIAFGKWKHEKVNAHENRAVDLVEVPGANVEARTEFFRLMNSARTKFVRGKDYLHLIVLATAPKHQGKGAGRLIMELGVKKADELGLPMYLDATPEGRRLYEKFGFVQVDSEPFDLRKYGVDKDYMTCSMLRQAKGATV